MFKRKAVKEVPIDNEALPKRSIREKILSALGTKDAMWVIVLISTLTVGAPLLYFAVQAVL